MSVGWNLWKKIVIVVVPEMSKPSWFYKLVYLFTLHSIQFLELYIFFVKKCTIIWPSYKSLLVWPQRGLVLLIVPLSVKATFPMRTCLNKKVLSNGHYMFPNVLQNAVCILLLVLSDQSSKSYSKVFLETCSKWKNVLSCLWCRFKLNERTELKFFPKFI